MVRLLRFNVSIVLSSVMITSLGEEGAALWDGCLLVCPSFFSVFTFYSSCSCCHKSVLRSLIVALPGAFFIFFL